MDDAIDRQLVDLEIYAYGLPSVGGGSARVSDLVTIHCASAADESNLLRSLQVPSCDDFTFPAGARCSDDFTLNAAMSNGEWRECEAGRALTTGITEAQKSSSGTAAAGVGTCNEQTSLEYTEDDEDGDGQDAEETGSGSSRHSIIPWLYDLEADEDQQMLDSDDSCSELINMSNEEAPGRAGTASSSYAITRSSRQDDVQGTEEIDGSHRTERRTSAPVNEATPGKRFQSDDRFRVVKKRSRLRQQASSSASGSQESSDGGGMSPEDDPRQRCPTVRICKTTPAFLRINPRDAEAEVSMNPTGGRALLSRTLDQVRRRLIDDLSPVLHDFDDDLKEIESAKLRSTYLKNLVVLSLGFMLVFTSFCALRSLQSSINHDRGLGLAALSCMNATFALGCVFATSIVQRVRPKRAIMLSLVGHLLFTAANIRATFYTLLPATALVGFTMATLLVAQGTYLTSIAVTYAAVSGKKHDHIVSLFNGFFLFMLQISQILGNLISSTVFSFLERDENLAAVSDDESLIVAIGTDERSRFKANQTNNESLFDLEAQPDPNRSVCGSGYCHMFLIESMHVDIYEETFVILVAFLCLISATGMVVIGLLLDKLDVIFHKSKQGLVAQLCAIVRLHRDRRMRLCVPLMTFLGIQEAFIYAEFTKGYITCPLGLHMIGYVMMCFAGCASLASVTVGYIQKYLRRSVIIMTGAICHLTLMAILFLWQPSSSDTVLIFLVAGGLGVVDATWQTVICSLCGVLFDRRHREASFSSLRMYQSLGLCLALGYAQFLCADVKIVIMAGMLLSALVAYFALEVCEKSKNDELEALEPASI